MKDEIKEILNRLDYDEWEVDLYKVPITWCELYNIRDYITNLQEENEKLKQWDCNKDSRNSRQRVELKKLMKENERLKKDLKTLWNVCWNNDTEMTSYQNEVFDNYYDMFHKNGGDEEC